MIAKFPLITRRVISLLPLFCCCCLAIRLFISGPLFVLFACKVVYLELFVVTGMSGVKVEFQGVDWGNEKFKSERGHLQRKARHVRHRKNKAFKKMAAAEMESLKRLRRFLHSMNNDELQPLLMERFVVNFFDDDGDHQQNVMRLQHDLASDDILSDVQKRAALTLLKGAFIRGGNFGEADDFLQTLFAIQDLDQMLESNKELFQGHLEAFYRRGEYDENKGRFLQRDLRVAQLADGNGTALVLELKRVLIDGRVVVEEGGDNRRREILAEKVRRLKAPAVRPLDSVH